MKTNKKEALILIFIGGLFILILIYINNKARTPLPKLLSVSPPAISAETVPDEGKTITISCKNITDNIAVYVDGSRINDVEIINETQFSFVLPKELAKKGNRKVYVKNIIKNAIDIKSNVIILNMLENIGNKRPVINAVTPKSTSEFNTTLKIEGDFFNEYSGVFINDIKQNEITLYDNQNIEVDISITNSLATQDTLNIYIEQEYDSNLRSSPYIFSAKPVLETKPQFKNSTEYLSKGYLVAHALGGYDGRTYTNSKEALLSNYDLGHRLFEIDFQFTSDNVLISLHDRGTPILTFNEEQKNVPYTLLSLEDLCDLMFEYDDFYIITDTKDSSDFPAIKRTFEYMNRMIKTIDPQLMDRFVIQVYNQTMYYYLINNFDFKSYIYTLYQSRDNNEQVVEFVKKTGIPAVTMPDWRATVGFTNELNDMGVRVFAHTVNDVDTAYALFHNDVYGIYTDFIKYDDMLSDRNDRYKAFSDYLNKRVLFSNYLTSGEMSNFNSMIQYINGIKDADNISCIITMKDTQEADLPQDIAESMQSLGLDFDLNDKTEFSYLAVISNKEVIYEDVAAEKIEHSWSVGKNSYKAISANNAFGNLSSIVINGIDYSANNRGINMVLYDNGNNEIISSVCFDPLDDYCNIGVSNAFIYARQSFMDYLDSIQKDNYIVLMSIMDEGSASIDEVIQNKLWDMGLNEDLRGKWRHGYAAVINGRELIFENITDDSSGVIYNEMKIENWDVSIGSSGYDSLCFSSVKINGTEYSKNSRGLNIVTFDKETGAIVDSVCFDTHAGIAFVR